MPPFDYLRQHITSLEQKLQQKAHSMSFRDPKYGTKTYTFTLYDEQGDNIYAARKDDGDSYQIGFSRASTYRESCYHCAFARPERVGDVILCDFYGLGKKTPFLHDKNEVSCILTATEKGLSLIGELMKTGKIFSEERPLQEALDGNPRLRITNPKTKDRLAFEKRIVQEKGDFEAAIVPFVLAYLKTLNRSRLYYHWQGVKYRIHKLFGK